MTSAALSAMRVVVTRPRAQAQSLVEALEAEGAVVVPVPVIEIVDPPDGGAALRAALQMIESGDWLVITSPNGAARVGAALQGSSLTPRAKVAVVGPGTRAAAEQVGLVVDLMPDDHIAEGLVAKFPPRSHSSGRVVLARAEVARETLPIELRMMGWTVDEVVAYRTQPLAVDDADRAACAAADAVVFTSGSTVAALVDGVGLTNLPPLVVSIGPATTARAEALGVNVAAQATDHTIPGVVAALMALR